VATLSDLIPRRAQNLVSEALEDTRVVLVNGARQAGKSTLTRLAADSRPLPWFGSSMTQPRCGLRGMTQLEIIELWPFSQGEMHDGPDRFIDAAFRHGAGLDRSSQLRKRDYLELAVAGGFPRAVRRTPWTSQTVPPGQSWRTSSSWNWRGN
jgi:predicted AAA+ superfamily ATPase